MATAYVLYFMYPDCQHVEHVQRKSGKSIKGFNPKIGSPYVISDGKKSAEYVVDKLWTKRSDGIERMNETCFSLILKHPYQH